LNNELFNIIKQRFLYHLFAPAIYIIGLGLIFRYGEIFGSFCGQAALLFILFFMVISIIFDHKEEIIDIIFWTLIRVITYTVLAVGFAIFMKEIFKYFSK
jgi:hypothetical protein